MSSRSTAPPDFTPPPSSPDVPLGGPQRNRCTSSPSSASELSSPTSSFSRINTSPYATPMSATCSSRTFQPREKATQTRRTRSYTSSSSVTSVSTSTSTTSSSRPVPTSRQSFTSSRSCASSSSVGNGSSRDSISTPTSFVPPYSSGSITVSRVIDEKWQDMTIQYSRALTAGVHAAGLLRDDFWHLSLKEVEEGTADGWVRLPQALALTGEEAEAEDTRPAKRISPGRTDLEEETNVFEAMFGAMSLDSPSLGVHDGSLSVLSNNSRGGGTSGVIARHS